MIPVWEMINNIKNEPSTNGKLKLLKEYKNAPVFIRILKYTYDPFKQYYTKTVPEQVTTGGGVKWGDMFDFLDKLSNRVYTGKLKDMELTKLVNQMTKKQYEIFKGILTKNLKIGLNAKSINKVIKGLIPEFNVHRPELIDLKNIPDDFFPAVLEEKYDGVRVITFMTNKPRFFTRNGREIFIPELEESLKKYINPKQPYVLDGELLSKDRLDISGLVNSSVKTGKPITSKDIVYRIFDIVDYEDWLNKNSHRPLSERKHLLVCMFEDNQATCFEITPFKIINKDEKHVILKDYEDIIKKGGEGIVVKSVKSPYKFKKDKSWLKAKETKTIDLKVTGYEWNNEHNFIGSLVAEDATGKLKVNVGSGLTLEDRRKNPEEYIGKVIEVKYNSIIPGDKSEYTLFLPRFVRVREDKNEIDNVDKILESSKK